MSHISRISLKITDLDALAKAAERCGLELVRGKTTYRWYEGDGQCEHALVQRKQLALNYEIGLTKAEDGSWEMHWDSYDERLANAVGGQDAAKLKQEYGASVATAQLYKLGMRVNRYVTSDGRIVVEGVS